MIQRQLKLKLTKKQEAYGSISSLIKTSEGFPALAINEIKDVLKKYTLL